MAVALLLVAGEFDFSIGVVAAASALLSALLIAQGGWSTWPALLGLLAALLVGLVNGVLVVNTGLPSFLVTLATLLVLQGSSRPAARRVSEIGPGRRPGRRRGWAVGRGRLRLDAGDRRRPVPRLAPVVRSAVTALATWALWRTSSATPCSPSAARGGRPRARRAGAADDGRAVLPDRRGRLADRRPGAHPAGRRRRAIVPGLATGVDFLVVAVIGGCLLTGGWGSAFGAAVAALLYAVARQGITLAGWDPQWFQVLLGVLLLVALVANGIVLRRLKAAPRS